MTNDILGEFLGTFILILFGTGFGLSNNLNKSYAKVVGNSWLGITISWGIAVMLGVYVALSLGASAHLNPAVSLVAAMTGGISMNTAFIYTGVQFLGAFLGALVAAVAFWPHFSVTKPEEGNNVGCFATGAALSDPKFNFLGEIIATFAFVFPVQFMTKQGVINKELLPIALGLLVIAVGLAFGSMTGYAINPARDLGPRLLYTLLPIPNKAPNSAQWSYAWIPALGPIIGALLAVLLGKLFE